MRFLNITDWDLSWRLTVLKVGAFVYIRAVVMFPDLQPEGVRA